MIEKQVNHSIASLDAFISGIDNPNLTLETYHKSSYIGFLLNFKISWIKCLIDRSFKICNNWNSFYKDIENIKSNLSKNVYPPFLIDKFIKKYLDHQFFSNHNQLKETLTFITLNYYISATFLTILKINFRNFAKNFVQKVLTLS